MRKEVDMRKTVLRIAALLILVLAINPVLIFAEESGYEYEAYEDYEEEAGAMDDVYEVTWQQIRVPLDSPRDFFIRVLGEVEVNRRNGRNWIWITEPPHIRWMEGLGADTSFFYSISNALLSTPQLHYAMTGWHWTVGTFWDLDMPTIHFFVEANTRVVFDFHAMTLMTLSWGSEAELEAEIASGLFLPGASITMPDGPSFTAVYVRGAYGPGNPIEFGHALILIEVLGEDGRRAPVYSHNPQDNIPSSWAQESVSRASELGILPEYMDRSLRRPLSRIELASFTVHFYEAITQSEIAGRTYFNDTIDVNAQKVGFLGVIAKNEYGNFNPGGLVTREQAAALAVRIASVFGLRLPSTDTYITDSGLISYWAYDAVRQAIGAGIMSAPDNFFDPQVFITREEFITMVVALYDLMR